MFEPRHSAAYVSSVSFPGRRGGGAGRGGGRRGVISGRARARRVEAGFIINVVCEGVKHFPIVCNLLPDDKREKSIRPFPSHVIGGLQGLRAC